MGNKMTRYAGFQAAGKPRVSMPVWASRCPYASHITAELRGMRAKIATGILWISRK